MDEQERLEKQGKDPQEVATRAMVGELVGKLVSRGFPPGLLGTIYKRTPGAAARVETLDGILKNFDPSHWNFQSRS